MSTESTDTRSSYSSSRSVSSYTETVNTADSWRVRKPIRKPPPLLRLTSVIVAQGPPSTTASIKPTLETIPASPPFEAMANDNSSGTQRHSPRTISFAAFGPPRAPSFEIPSEATLRWAKMERLKRKLGDGVPAELVFPSADADVETLTSDSVFQWVASDNGHGSVETSSSKTISNVPRSSFSLASPLFAIVEGPEDHVSGCFDFGSRRERAAFAGENGRRRG